MLDCPTLGKFHLIHMHNNQERKLQLEAWQGRIKDQ